jgi:hypothetical protein
MADYRKDKALRHLAAASEMAGVCHFMLGTEAKKQDECLDTAYTSYIRSTATRDPNPESRTPNPETLTLNPEPRNLNPKPRTPKPKP